MTVMTIDGMNFIHRARAGFIKGENSVVFNFFRNFRALIEQFNPTRVYFVLDGVPTLRNSLYTEYKATRKIDQADEEAVKAQMDFYRQKDTIVYLLEKAFPVIVVGHYGHEADDVIFNLINKSKSDVDWTVVSNDSDFIQLLDTFQNVSIYNPMKKEFVERVEYDYVTWKSLCGDGADNIPGIPGIGPVRAEKLARDLEALREFLTIESNGDTWIKNYNLIKFIEFTSYELSEMSISNPRKNWKYIKESFEEMNFKTLLIDKTWNKFVDTFDYLWGELLEPIENPYETE